MKTLISIELAVLTSASVALGGAFEVKDFINGTDIQLTNNSTLVYTQQNVFYKYVDLSERWALASSNQPVTYVTSTATYYWTNTVVNNTNIVNPAAWTDVSIHGDANANHCEASISVVAALTSAAGTNKYTVKFAHMPDGQNVDTVNGNGVNLITLSFDIFGTTNTCYSTNLLQTFVQGGGKIRLLSVASANSTTNDFGYIRKISLNGFVP